MATLVTVQVLNTYPTNCGVPASAGLFCVTATVTRPKWWQCTETEKGKKMWDQWPERYLPVNLSPWVWVC